MKFAKQTLTLALAAAFQTAGCAENQAATAPVAPHTPIAFSSNPPGEKSVFKGNVNSATLQLTNDQLAVYSPQGISTSRNDKECTFVSEEKMKVSCGVIEETTNKFSVSAIQKEAFSTATVTMSNGKDVTKNVPSNMTCKIQLLQP